MCVITFDSRVRSQNSSRWKAASAATGRSRPLRWHWAKKRKATLLVAKLDRLSRNVAFISALMDSRGFDLAITDIPGANRLTLHVLAGARTRHALATAKVRGVNRKVEPLVLANTKQAKQKK